MLRILWILSLASLTIGTSEPPWPDFKGGRRPPWANKSVEQIIIAWASSDQPFASFLPGYSPPESDTESSTDPCESASNCHLDSSATSTASPVVKPGTLDDDDYDFDFDDDYDAPFQRIHELAGSVKGTPGEDYPDFTDFPETSFSCSDQDYVPGYYADPESRCQVYHVCWPDRRDSFLCPVGKIYNQESLACDHWYNSNCSLAPHYYSVNGDPEMVLTKRIAQAQPDKIIASDPGMRAFLMQFIPVKGKIKIFPETSDSKSKTFASVGKRKKRHISTTESRDFTQAPQSTTEAPQSTTEEAQYSTQSPDCPETIKYIDVEAAVRLIFERLDNVVKNIIREMKENVAANDAKKTCSTAHTDKISVPKKIEHKLAPIPLEPPMVEEEEPVIASKTDAAVDPTATKPPVADCHKKPVGSRIKRSRLAISPLTKKALIESYINLFKLRKS